MTTDTPLDIKEGRKLLAGATEAPWHRHTYGHANLTDIASEVTRSIGMGEWRSTDASYVHTDDEALTVAFTGNGPKQTDHADLIVWLRNNAEALLAAAEALQIIAAPPTDAPNAIGVTARNIARAALGTHR